MPVLELSEAEYQAVMISLHYITGQYNRLASQGAAYKKQTEKVKTLIEKLEASYGAISPYLHGTPAALANANIEPTKDLN